MLEIVPIPILNDNYAWLIISADRSRVSVVDPGEATPVIDYIKANQIKLDSILITHSHRDHIGGIDDLLDFQKVPVFGPRCEAIPQITEILSEGDKFKLWGEHEITIIETPGHLPEHICFFMNMNGQFHLFCGDILFSAGCGRNFVGTSQEFYDSLQKLSRLPASTKFYCAHEYTQSNLKFAVEIEPFNQNIIEKINKINEVRKRAKPSLPGTIGEELLINPFMRCHIEEVKKKAENYAKLDLLQGHEIFGVLRKWKDNF